MIRRFAAWARHRRVYPALPALLVLLSVLGGGCTRRPEPVTVASMVAEPPAPVVLVPGLTGSMLRSRRSGETVWIDGPGLFLPRDGGYGLALPIPHGDETSDPGEPRLEPFAVLESIRMGPLHRGIYGPLLRSLERNGYRRGRLSPPSDPHASLYTFAYDWRRSAVRAAGELADALEALRRSRGEERLEVDLICQSSGAYVCRWLAKYGGASVEEVETFFERVGGVRVGGAEVARTEPGRSSGSDGVRIRRLILVGSANGGALRSLRELHRGRRYLAPFGRRMRPEVLFTFPALYEDLPHRIVVPGPVAGGAPVDEAEKAREGSVFIDRRGDPLPRSEVDLYDPQTWVRRGWSVFDPESARRVAASGRRDLFGTAAEREAFLARSLESARRFQKLLARDPESFEGVGRPRYYLVGNAYAETPRRAVLLGEGSEGRRPMLFAGDRDLTRRPYLEARATGPGDGHATVESMHHLSPAEREVLAAEPFYISGGHFEMIVEPATHRRILEFLSDPP